MRYEEGIRRAIVTAIMLAGFALAAMAQTKTAAAPAAEEKQDTAKKAAAQAPAAAKAAPAATAQPDTVKKPAAQAAAPAQPAAAAPKPGSLELTLEQLSKYNGRNGQPAYVAVDGVIYDVTNAKGWKMGKHQGFAAGRDVTALIKKESPHGVKVLKRNPVAGKLAVVPTP